MKKLIITALFLMLMTPFILAQEAPGTIQIDNNMLAAILGAWGIGVIGISELLKQGLKKFGFDTWPKLLRHFVMYLVTLGVSACATVFTLIKMGQFQTGDFVLYSVIVWGIANGLWKGGRNAVKKALEDQ